MEETEYRPVATEQLSEETDTLVQEMLLDSAVLETQKVARASTSLEDRELVLEVREQLREV